LTALAQNARIRQDAGPACNQKRSCAEFKTSYVVIVDWQQIVSLSIVGITAAALLWSKFRPRKLSLQRATHCGCASPSQSASQSSIIFRARRGERPQILIKMK
jgi:hypothetical protein